LGIGRAVGGKVGGIIITHSGGTTTFKVGDQKKWIAEIEEGINIIPELKRRQAEYHEKLLEFDEAAEIYKELELEDDVVRVRKLKAEQGAVKVTQKVVHGDEISNTEIKDSVLNRSNIGTGGKSKSEELREAKALLDDGLIDDEEFKQMKKEILGK